MALFLGSVSYNCSFQFSITVAVSTTDCFHLSLSSAALPANFKATAVLECVNKVVHTKAM